MKKTMIIAATIATLSAMSAAAPAEARGLHVRHGVAGAAVATAIAVGVAANAYGYGPGYGYYAPGYYETGYVVYGPHVYRGWAPY